MTRPLKGSSIETLYRRSVAPKSEAWRRPDLRWSEPLAWMLRPGSAGSTAADHLTVLEAAIAALPPGFRRRLMVTADGAGAGAGHELITRMDKLATRPGHQLTYSVGWELGRQERAAIAQVPGQAWQIAIDAHGEIRERRADDGCDDDSQPVRRGRARAPPSHTWRGLCLILPGRDGFASTATARRATAGMRHRDWSAVITGNGPGR